MTDQVANDVILLAEAATAPSATTSPWPAWKASTCAARPSGWSGPATSGCTRPGLRTLLENHELMGREDVVVTRTSASTRSTRSSASSR
jgi:hypothetical protein